MSKLIKIVFLTLIVVSGISLFVHWAQLAPPGGAGHHPPGDEWFSMQRIAFKKWPWLTQIHLLSSLVFILLAPFQFSEKLRSRFLKWHRAFGRLFIINTFPMAASGLVLGVVIPFGGFGETVYGVVLFLMVMLAACQGVVSIRRGEVLKHRAWMTRLFAWATSIATMRIIMGTFYHIQPWSDRDWFWITLHLGLVVNIITAEIWIRRNQRVVYL